MAGRFPLKSVISFPVAMNFLSCAISFPVRLGLYRFCFLTMMRLTFLKSDCFLRATISFPVTIPLISFHVTIPLISFPGR